LTTASDEPGEQPILGGWLERPLRPVLFNPAPSRGQVGSITPQSQVRRPYGKALRVVGMIWKVRPLAPRGFQTGTNAKAPVASKLWRNAQNR